MPERSEEQARRLLFYFNASEQEGSPPSVTILPLAVAMACLKDQRSKQVNYFFISTPLSRKGRLQRDDLAVGCGHSMPERSEEQASRLLFYFNASEQERSPPSVTILLLAVAVACLKDQRSKQVNYFFILTPLSERGRGLPEGEGLP